MGQINKASSTKWIITLVLMLVFTLTGANAVSQTYTSIVTLTPSSDSGMNINIIKPVNTYFNANSIIEFRFVVGYNRMNPLVCNITLDGSSFQAIEVRDGLEKVTTASLTLNSGYHTWYVSCEDEQFNADTSETSVFTVDLSPPTIDIHNNDPDITLTEIINLSFTPQDDYSTSLNCVLATKKDNSVAVYNTINNIPKGEKRTIQALGLDHGNYTWNVSCTDKAGNTGSTPNKRFYVDLEKDFSIELNQNSYLMGESGVYVVEGPYGSQITLVITTPKKSTIIKDYYSPYPKVDSVSFNYPGTYLFQGLLNYNGAIKKLEKSITVENSLSVKIVTEINSVEPNQTFYMKARDSGGIGNVSILWDFGDDTETTNSNNISHSYKDYGDYEITLSAKDSYGNTAEDKLLMKVKKKETILFSIIDNTTGEGISNAQVFLNGIERKTDVNGNLSVSIFPGNYHLNIFTEEYNAYFTKDFEVKKSENITIRLNKSSSADHVDGNSNSGSNVTAYISSEDITAEPKASIDAQNQDRTINLIDNLVESIDNALKDLKDLSSEETKISESISLEKNLERNKNSIIKLRRDIYNLGENKRNLTNSELQEERAKIIEEVGKISSTTITRISSISYDEFVKYATTKDISSIIEEYATYYNISNKKEFVNSNKALQDRVSISTRIDTVKVTYLDKNENTSTIVTHTVVNSNTADSQKLVLSVAPDIKKSMTEIVSSSSNKAISNGNLIEFELKEGDKITYIISGDVNNDDIKSIKGVIISNSAKSDKSSKSSITGNTVFSDIGSTANPVLMIQVVIIVILLIVYLVYQMNIMEKFELDISAFFSKLINKELKDVYSHMEDVQSALAANEPENAEILMSDVEESYNKLSQTGKNKILPKIENVKVDIMKAKANDMVNKALEHIKNKENTKAEELYSQIQEIYKSLPKEKKVDLADKCRNLFEKLSSQ